MHHVVECVEIGAYLKCTSDIETCVLTDDFAPLVENEHLLIRYNDTGAFLLYFNVFEEVESNDALVLLKDLLTIFFFKHIYSKLGFNSVNVFVRPW